MRFLEMNNHGGKRQGSGRKNEGKVQVCYRLAPDVVEFLKDRKRRHRIPASRIIEDAVRSYKKFLEINDDRE